MSQSPVEIIPVTTRKEQKQFTRFAWELYQDEPHWVPPLRKNQEELLGFHKHPFHLKAEMQTFLARQDGKVCGRIAAIINHAHNEKHKESRGFFGFYECIDNQQVSDALFDAALNWLKERNINNMRGPMNPSINYEVGLLTEGFDKPPTFMMTYNHSYYQKLIEGYGFKKEEDLYSFWGHIDMLDQLDEKLDFIIAEATRRFNVNIRPMDTSRFLEEVKTFLDIYNKSLVGHWGCVPLSDEEINHMAGDMQRLIVPEMTSIAEVDGKPIGVVFGLLDYNPRIKKIDGKLFPFGFLRLLMNKRAIKKIRLISTNVLPEYQRWGVGLLLLSRLVPDVLAFGIEEAEFSWVAESNSLSYGSLKRGGAIIDKTYRIYDYGEAEPLTEEASLKEETEQSQDDDE